MACREGIELADRRHAVVLEGERTLISLDVRYKDVAEKLEEARRRHNLDILYIQGMGYYRDRQWPAAREKLCEICQVDETYKDVAAILEKLDHQEELEVKYQSAEESFDGEDWEAAARLFEEIAAVDPGYLDVQSRLEEAERQYQLRHLYQEAITHFNRREWSQATDGFRKVVELDEGFEEAAAKLKEAEEQRELRERYEKALAMEDAGEWEEACQAYVEIIGAVSPYPYEDAAERLAGAQRRTTLAQMDSEADELWAEGHWQAAIDKLDEAIQLTRRHKDVDRQVQRDLVARQRSARKRLKTQQVAYEKGLEHLAAEEWPQAAEALGQVLESSPRHAEAAAGFREAEERSAELVGTTLMDAAEPVAVEVSEPTHETTPAPLDGRTIARRASLAGALGLVLALPVAVLLLQLGAVQTTLLVGGSILVLVALVLIREALVSGAS